MGTHRHSGSPGGRAFGSLSIVWAIATLWVGNLWAAAPPLGFQAPTLWAAAPPLGFQAPTTANTTVKTILTLDSQDSETLLPIRQQPLDPTGQAAESHTSPAHSGRVLEHSNREFDDARRSSGSVPSRPASQLRQGADQASDPSSDWDSPAFPDSRRQIGSSFASSGSAGHRPFAQDPSPEALPRPRSNRSPADGSSTSDSNRVQDAEDGIVRLLKPLVVEPQQREVLTQRYPDGQVMIQREVRLDSHGNYMNDGSWKMYHVDQELLGLGRFDNGQMAGLWRRVHHDREHPWLGSSEFRGFTFPLLSSAQFVDGQLHGPWVITDQEDRKLIELNYRHGQRHGAGIWFHPDGQMRRQLHFDNNLLHGPWREWNASGELLTENWFKEGRRIHKELSYFSAGKPESETSFLEGQWEVQEPDDWWNGRLAAYQLTGPSIQTGPIKAWYDNGQKHMAGYYHDGQRHGEFAWWHPNGNRKLVGAFQNGQRVGTWVWWHENGIKAAEGQYEDDLPVGSWLSWNEQGQQIGSTEMELDRETLARPPFHDVDQPPIDEDLEELPPRMPWEAPSLPSLPQLDLPPPESTDEASRSTDAEGSDTTDPQGRTESHSEANSDANSDSDSGSDSDSDSAASPASADPAHRPAELPLELQPLELEPPGSASVPGQDRETRRPNLPRAPAAGRPR